MRKLTRQEAAVAVAAAVILLGVLVWQGGALRAAYRVQGAVDGVKRTPGYPPGHAHLAHPDDIGGVLWGPHPVYCDQDGPGKYRDRLIERGWEFMSDPPGEATI
jgi:hypothetical protein